MVRAIGGYVILFFLALCTAALALLFGCAHAAPTPLKPPANMERLGSDFKECPDGTIIEREVYDPDPNDRNAFVLVFKRGDRIVAIFESKTMTLILASGEEVDVVTAAQRWPSPCFFPQGV